MKPELLMPAGDMEKLKFAFQYGADAVYAGVPVFSLRARENQFNIESVREAVDYAKKLGKKIYLTVNIFPHNSKLPALRKAIKPMADLKPDAFIVADPGVIMLFKEIAPEIPLHLSVQANNVNWASARFWHKQGIERIILSREISLPEIREIHENNPGLELEFFVHGSICMAYSGRCLLSSYFTYRDANQGTCAHSCRWEYKVYESKPKTDFTGGDFAESGLKSLNADYYLEDVTRPGNYLQIDEDSHGTYIMNSKDLCLIEYLRELKEAGICSFKVEGRNKTLYYAATVAKVYRQAVDDMEAGLPLNPEYIKELAKTSNRGFIPGFLSHDRMHKAQEYEKNITYQTHEFIAVVRAIHERAGKKLYEIEVKG
jgi:putative protease